MERTSVNEIMFVCENNECKEPLFIPVMLEACLNYFSVLVCAKCGQKHSDLAELKEFSKQTKSYGQL